MTAVQDCLLWSAEDVSTRFLESIVLGDAEIAEHLLARDVDYRFGWLRRSGRSRVAGWLDAATGRRLRFTTAIVDVHADRTSVAMTRIDRMQRGPLHVQLTVYGDVRVVDGKIVRWVDTFGYTDLAVALVRGVVGVVVPPLRGRLPT